MKQIVIFDLDGTIVKGQTQKMLVEYAYKEGLISLFHFFKIIIWFFLYKASLVKNPRKIMEYGYSFLKGKEVKEMDLFFNNFFYDKIKKKIYKKAVDEILKYKKRNTEIIIVSNSIEQILAQVATSLKIENYLGTKLESKNGKFTGKIKNSIIYAKKKVDAIQSFVSKKDLDLRESVAFSDHHSDTPLLEEVTYPIVVNPDAKLKIIAQKNNWPILNFKDILNEF